MMSEDDDEGRGRLRQRALTWTSSGVALVGHCSALALAVLALVISAERVAAADANPPSRMTYQGYLVDGNGLPLGDTAPKNYDVIFRLYDVQTGGTTRWTEQQTVTVDKGYFSVLLGEGSQVGSEPRPGLSTLFTGADASDRFVGMTVKGIGAGGSDATILPRLRLLTSPYSFLARNAISAGNLVNSTNSQVVSISGTSVGINKPIPGSALDVNGTVTASAFSGNGAALTALNAANVTTGTLDPNRVPSLDAAKIATGTLDANRIPNLDATKIASGTLNVARLPANVALTDGNQTYTGRPVLGNGANLRTSSLFIRGDNDVNHVLRYCGPFGWANMDGPLLGGWDGGVLGHSSGGQAVDLLWNATGVTITGQAASSGQGDYGTAQRAAQHLTLQARDMVNGVRLTLGMSHVFNTEYAGVIQAYSGANSTTTLRLNPLGGSVYQTSDRNVKTDFESIEPREVLEKLSAMPVTKWKYKGEDKIVHMGPTAQDFRAAFGLGSDDRGIGLPDGPGVAMAAIQGLHQIVKDKDAEIQGLKKELEDLRGMKQELNALRVMIDALQNSGNPR